MVVRCLIDRTWLIEYNQVKSSIRIMGMQIYIFKLNIEVH